VEKHGEVGRARFHVGHRRGDSNGMRSASREEEGPRKGVDATGWRFVDQGGPGFSRWSEKPICVSDEGQMLLLLIVSAKLGYSLVDVSPPRPILTSAPNVTLLNGVHVSEDGPAPAGLCFGG